MNTLANSKYFQIVDKKTNFVEKLSKTDLTKYYVPENLYLDRLGSFKATKSPMVNDVIEYIKNKRLIPVLLDEPAQLSDNKGKSLHDDPVNAPYALFQIKTKNEKNEPVLLVDLSYKAKYNRINTTNEPIYLEIDDIAFYNMMMAGYIQLKITEKPSILKNEEFYLKVAEYYTLIMSKVIDNVYPMVEIDKIYTLDQLYVLIFTFCLQSFFDIDKDVAIEYAIKQRNVYNKYLVRTNSLYNNTNYNLMDGVDYKTVFPIDNFAHYLPKEFKFIKPSDNITDIILQKFVLRLNKNAVFSMDSLSAFLNMYVMAKSSLGVFNDLMFKRYIFTSKGEDLMKTIYKCING